MAKSKRRNRAVVYKSKVGRIGCRSNGVGYNLPYETWMILFDEIDQTKNYTQVAEAHRMKRQTLARKYQDFKEFNADPTTDTRGYCKRIFTVREELQLFDILWNEALVSGYDVAFSNESIVKAALELYKKLSSEREMRAFDGSVGWLNGFKKRHGIYVANGLKYYYAWRVTY